MTALFDVLAGIARTGQRAPRARSARGTRAPGGTPLKVTEDPSVPTTLKSARVLGRAVAPRPLLTGAGAKKDVMHWRF